MGVFELSITDLRENSNKAVKRVKQGDIVIIKSRRRDVIGLVPCDPSHKGGVATISTSDISRNIGLVKESLKAVRFLLVTNNKKKVFAVVMLPEEARKQACS